jgi:hypothetical protein
MENENNRNQPKLNSSQVNQVYPTPQNLPIVSKPKRNTKILRNICIALILIVILTATFLLCLKFSNNLLIGSEFFSNLKQKITRSILISNNINPFLVEKFTQERTTHIVYIQNNDLWLSSIDKSNPDKIAVHTPTSFTYRNMYGSGNINSSWDDHFINQPRISGDAKYIIYEKISDKALRDLDIWKSMVATESAEIKKSGDSLAFSPPTVSYNTILYDINDKTTTIIDSQIGTSEKDYLELFNWAKDTNILPIHTTIRKNNGIAFIYKTKNGIFKLTSLEKLLNKQFNDTFNSAENSWDVPMSPLLSPDGTRLIAYYQYNNPPRSCNNTWGYKSYYINLLTNELNKLFLSPSATCGTINIGWIGNDKFITLEILPASKFHISAWSNNASVQQTVVDYEGYPSQISYSPNGKWLSFLLENIQTKKIEYVFINVSTKKSINLFYFMGDNGKHDINYSEIFTPKWNRESSIAYIKAKRKDSNTYDIVSYNAERQEYKIYLENVSDFDIN